MGLLIFSLRRQELLRHKSFVDARLMQLSEKLTDLHSYASSIGSGPVSLNSLMNVPTSLFGRMTSYMAMSNQMAMAQAQREMSVTMSMPGAQQNLQAMTNGNVQMQQNYQNMMLQQYYQQAMDQASKQEEQLLNAQEEKITSEKTKLEEESKMIEAELSSLDKAVDKAAQDAAPKYA